MTNMKKYLISKIVFKTKKSPWYSVKNQTYNDNSKVNDNVYYRQKRNEDKEKLKQDGKKLKHDYYRLFF